MYGSPGELAAPTTVRTKRVWASPCASSSSSGWQPLASAFFVRPCRLVSSGWTGSHRPSVAGWRVGLPHNRTAAHWPPALAAWWIVHPRALSESSSDSEGPKTGCLEHLVPGSLRGGFGWQPALACGWPPFTQVTGLLAAFLAAGVDWRLSWFRMTLDPRTIRMIVCSWSSLEPGADLGVGSWSSVCLLCL